MRGTLFGKNTIGGVVNVISKRPTGELGGEVALRAGNHRRFDVRAALDFPIVEDLLAARISVLGNNSDGDYDNQVNGDEANGDDVQAVRGKLLLTPNENFEALLTLAYDTQTNRKTLNCDRSRLPEKWAPPASATAGTMSLTAWVWIIR